ncbi:MAG: fibronectin type III domain-containing protein [Phycisphaerae bacterium]|nr:fibronectin type III domain-containing protein [Phycisphaerae bacterium]
MAEFPRVNMKVVALAMNMIDGIESHPEIFPSSDPDIVKDALEDFQASSSAYLIAQANAKQAANAKAAAIDKLKSIMKNQIRLARVDTTAKPEYMYYIGVNQRRKPATIQPPLPPSGLHLEMDSDNNMILSWKKPQVNKHRPVCIYIIQQRPADYSEPWQLAGVSYDNYYQLQPKQIQNDKPQVYRIIATNEKGSSLPSGLSPHPHRC